MLRNSYQHEKASCFNIKVIVRCRPLNEKEKNDINNEEVVKINNNEVIVTLSRNNEIYEKKYSFDYACDKDVDQRTLFNNYVFQIVDEVLEGFNCTLFCYGQTGTGKTYTMEGRILEHLKHNENKKLDLSDSINSDLNYYYELCDNDDTGIIFRVAKRIFDILNSRKEYKTTRLSEVSCEENCAAKCEAKCESNFESKCESNCESKCESNCESKCESTFESKYESNFESKCEGGAQVVRRRNSYFSSDESLSIPHMVRSKVEITLNGFGTSAPSNVIDSNIDSCTQKNTPFEGQTEKKDVKSVASDMYNMEKCSYDFVIKVSYLEIYNEELCDLLSTASESNKLRIYEDTMNKNKGLNVDKLEEKCINSFEEIYYLICSAIKKRRTAETSYNKKSSRSHSIFTITLIMKDLNNDGESITKIGKLNLVDLAGSENALKSSYGNLKIRQQESCNINQSLLTLGRVINALIENSSYIPYRDSKLTRLLQDSLGGKTKTFIVATISPSSLCIDETLSTLDYVFRAKNIKNRPEINVKTTKQLKIKDLNNEIEKLKNALNLSREKRGVYLDNEEYNNIQNSLKKNKEILLQKEKILFEKSKKIKALINKMDYTDDIQNHIVQFLKDILLKYKNIQIVHDILVNKLVEEKCVTRFLLSEFKQMQEKYQNYVNTYTQTQKKIISIFRETISTIKRKKCQDYSHFNHICNDILKILVNTKDEVMQGKEILIKSIENMEHKSTEMLSRKNDFLDFFQNQIGVMEKQDQTHFCQMEKMKNDLLTCTKKLNADVESFSNHIDQNKIADFVVQQPYDTSDEYSLISINKEKKKIAKLNTSVQNKKETINMLKKLAPNDESFQVINEIDFYLSGEKEENVKSIIQYMKNINKLLHIFLTHSLTELKKNVNEKTTSLRSKREYVNQLIEKLQSDYKSQENNLNKRKCEIAERYKKIMTDDIYHFKDRIMEEIHEVIQRNVVQINETMERKLELLTNELNEESGTKYREIFTHSLNTLEQFIQSCNKQDGEYHDKYFQYTNLMHEKVDTYYEHLLEHAFTDINYQFANEQSKINEKIQNIKQVYLNLIQNNNKCVDKISILFDTTIGKNKKDKEALCNSMSKMVLQEKNQIAHGEKKKNELTLKYTQDISLYNQQHVENLKKCNTHMDALLQHFNKNEAALKDDDDDNQTLPTCDVPENHMNEEDIHVEIEKIRSFANMNSAILSDPYLERPTLERPTLERPNLNEGNSNFAISPRNGSVKPDLSNNHYRYSDIHYEEVKGDVMKEIETFSFQKNIDFKCLFDKVDENLNLILNENYFLKYQKGGGGVVSGSCELSRRNSGGSMTHASGNPIQHMNEVVSLTGESSCTHMSSVGNNIAKVTHIQSQKKARETSSQIDADVEGTNLKSLAECNRKNNKSIESLHGRKIGLTSNELKYSSTKIKVLGNSASSRKNSPAPKRLKDDGYKGRNFKFIRKSED
ncbi:kinesin-5 [Plasmodium gonderi]|uniref:Kinesin-5 n=1 Tax=Plasmodium gonderi TaxID=77519 RepID=A0A1Y1JG64_PLAGO|nr:kinesin-5 [Plasmodium gonderi]GAW80648.1 kinesin-5 [Plasmodium gonderi]